MLTAHARLMILTHEDHFIWFTFSIFFTTRWRLLMDSANSRLTLSCVLHNNCG